jgi:hypothetical protein
MQELTVTLSKLATATKSARSDWCDNACAAVLALARRAGPTATEIYLTAIQVPSPSVREYAMFVLAAEGNDRG